MKYKSVKGPNSNDTVRTVIDSEEFDGVQYEIKDEHLIIFGGACGALSIRLKNLKPIIKELYEISEVWQ